MKAVCWQGKHNVRVENVKDPEILNPRDCIVKVTSSSICGSDLHIYNGMIPTMKRGDILGHEFMGEVVEVGPGAKDLKVGDRVVVPFAIACGHCHFCLREEFALCDNSNPHAFMKSHSHEQCGAGLFGSSHTMGGYAGGQAEFVRVPFADVGPLKIPSDLEDERALFLSDVFPAGWMAAENCGIEPGDSVAVWGCGPVGLFAIQSAYLLGAHRVIAIDHVQYRLDLAEQVCGADVINYEKQDLFDELLLKTGGRGPDSCIDAVGMEPHGNSMISPDRLLSLRQVIQACRKGGVVSIPGVYSGSLDNFPIGTAFEKGLSLRLGHAHIHRYMKPLLQMILNDQIDPTFVVSHRMGLEQAAQAYEIFQTQQDSCVKVVLTPEF